MTLNSDGSPQASVVWVALQSTPEGDELVSAHLSESYQKVRNVRRDSRVVATITGVRGPNDPVLPYLVVTGTPRITEGGAPELLTALNAVLAPENIGKFPPPDAPPGFLTRIRIDKIGGVGV